jgi:hypothetical protein
MADAALCPTPYAGIVFTASSAANLAAATAPLFSSFGDDLTLWRDGNVVHWSYEGQTIVIEQQADGAATASFVDAPSTDEISRTPASAIYRRTADRRYHLNEDSCRAMVGDMIAFFSGEREPFFTFVGARSLDA